MTPTRTSKIQIGRESTAGTGVAASTLWRSKGWIKDTGDPRYVEEDIGVISGSDRTTTPRYGAELELEPVELTAEQFPHLMEMSVKTDSPSQDGAGTGYVYQYELPTTTAGTLKNYTVEAGDGQQEEEFYFGYCRSWKIAGKGGENWMMSGTLAGRQVNKSSFTGSISAPSVSDFPFSKYSLYLDAVGGSFGGTQKTLTLLEAEIEYTSGWAERFADSGDRYYSHLGLGEPAMKGFFTVEHNATGVAMKDDRIAETARKMRLNIAGVALGTPATYTAKLVRLDLMIKFLSVEKVVVDGNNGYKLNWESRYNITAADWGTIYVVNELSSLP